LEIISREKAQNFIARYDRLIR